MAACVVAVIVSGLEATDDTADDLGLLAIVGPGNDSGKATGRRGADGVGVE